MIRKTLLFVSTLLLFISCDKTSEIQIEQGVGAVSLSFSEGDINKKSANDAIPNAVLLTIEDTNGENVINNRKLTLTSFGSSYITEDIELIQGDYAITSFNIVDEDNVVIYSSPLENSELADLVQDPLPINFSVIEGETNTVSPEVVFVGPTATPEQFGYTSFSFTIVDMPTELEDQDLYISITEIVDGLSNEFVEGNIIIEIPSQDLVINAQIFIDHIPITIPVTTDNEEIKITVIYEDYENQTFTLNTDQISSYNEEVPYEVYFDKDTIEPSSIILYINLHNADLDDNVNHVINYSYTTQSGTYNDLGDSSTASLSAIHLPYGSGEEIFQITFTNLNYTEKTTVEFTTQQITDSNQDNTLDVYLEKNTRKFYFQVFDTETNNLIPIFYVVDIEALNFYEDGNLEANDELYIEIPDDIYNELGFSIEDSSGGLGGTLITIDSETVKNYTVSNPLKIYL